MFGDTKTNPTVVIIGVNRCMCNHVYSVAWLIKVVRGMQSVMCVNMLQHVTVVTHRLLAAHKFQDSEPKTWSLMTW